MTCSKHNIFSHESDSTTANVRQFVWLQNPLNILFFILHPSSYGTVLWSQPSALRPASSIFCHSSFIPFTTFKLFSLLYLRVIWLVFLHLYFPTIESQSHLSGKALNWGADIVPLSVDLKFYWLLSSECSNTWINIWLGLTCPESCLVLKSVHFVTRNV